MLAHALSQADSIAQGFIDYQSRRMERVKRIVMAAEKNASKYHLLSAPALGGPSRHRRPIPLRPAPMVRQFDWIYGHDVTQEGAEKHRSPSKAG